MARQSNELLMAWSSISSDESRSGWQAISLASAGQLKLRAGRRSPENAESVLVGFPSKRLGVAEKLPEGQGFAVERVDLEDNDHLWLGLTRKSGGSAEIFRLMVCDVISALDHAVANGADETKLMKVFIGRVAGWQEFMRKGTQTLSAESEIGLIGELLVLHEIIKIGVSSVVAIESWVGPLDGVQDFEIGTGVLEVKSTISNSGFLAKIGSLDQLDDSLRQPLFLVGVRLKQAANGKNLPEIVKTICDELGSNSESDGLLIDRLLAGGYVDAHAESYFRKFELVEMLLLEVVDTFPRLISGKVPVGIMKTTYEIDIEKIHGENLCLTEALIRLGAI